MNNDLQTTEELFDEIPEEIQHYIYSDDFDAQLSTLLTKAGLNKDQQIEFRGKLFAFIAQIENGEELTATINQLVGVEYRPLVIDWISENVIKKIFSLVEKVYIEVGDEGEPIEEGSPTETVPTQENLKSVLANLSSVQKSSPVTPITRDYSIDSVMTEKQPSQDAPKSPLIDPYHEPVDLICYHKALQLQRFVRYTSNMQFKVPQFIDVEDKVFGPLTFKQFAYLAGGAGLVYLSFKILPTLIGLVFASIFAGLALALTFFRYNDKPFAFTLQAFVRYITHPRLYLWHKDYSAQKTAAPIQTKAVVAQKGLSESKLQTLSWSLDVIDPNKN